MEATPVTLDQIVSLSKRRGFIFQSSEIYGGLGACWDYGPLGVELKQNIKDCWWDFMVRTRENVVGMDGSILMHPEVWVARTRWWIVRSPRTGTAMTNSLSIAIRVEPTSPCSLSRRGTRRQPKRRSRSWRREPNSRNSLWFHYQRSPNRSMPGSSHRMPRNQAL